jgi:hypothetical protein
LIYKSPDGVSFTVRGFKLYNLYEIVRLGHEKDNRQEIQADADEV